MNVTKFPLKSDEDLAEETGWHIGDGSMNYYNNKGYSKGFYQLRGHICDDKLHYIFRIKPIFKKLYGININLREIPSTRVFGFQIWSNELVKFKEGLGLNVGPKTEVKIPDIFLKNKGLIKAIIRGIFDTDGCVYLEKKNKKLYPRLEIFTISNELGNQLYILLNKLGFRTTIYLSEKFKNKRGRTPGYKISIRGVEMFHKFIKEVSPKNQKHIAKYKLFIQSFK